MTTDRSNVGPMVPSDTQSPLARRVAETLAATRESWTRRMFELADQMRRSDPAPVFDLSLGNPSLEPPNQFFSAIRRLLEVPVRGAHRYMSNVGFADVRQFIADRESVRYRRQFTVDDVVMSVGAAGGLNVMIQAMLDPGDEVIVPGPHFSEYSHYTAMAGATLVQAEAGPDLELSLSGIEAKLSSRTRWLLLNSPNNPTGTIYSASQLDALAALLEGHNRGRARPIVVVEDSPYRNLTYDGCDVPSMMTRYDHTVLVTSHSKDLGLAGERIGYVVVSPELHGRRDVARGAAYCTRVLGFVNAPALMQRVLPILLADGDARVDVEIYARRARKMADGLRQLGFDLPEPRAGFFLFPRVPAGFRGPAGVGDVGLVEQLTAERTLVVPGTAFGAPNYIRLSMAVEDAAVDGALAAFMRVCQN